MRIAVFSAVSNSASVWKGSIDLGIIGVGIGVGVLMDTEVDVLIRIGVLGMAGGGVKVFAGAGVDVQAANRITNNKRMSGRIFTLHSCIDCALFGLYLAAQRQAASPAFLAELGPLP
jgi:hypothetical protein